MIETTFVGRGHPVLILILIILVIFFLILIFILILLCFRCRAGQLVLHGTTPRRYTYPFFPQPSFR